jgi:hypothetical protein
LGCAKTFLLDEYGSFDAFYEWAEPVAVGGFVVVSRCPVTGVCTGVEQVDNTIFADIPGNTQPDKATREAYWPADSQDSDSSTDLSTGAIIGVAVGAVAGVALVVAAIGFKNKRQADEKKDPLLP